ncbi:hypothetical protein GWK47_035868 [Chionoecetes opilio]|uniref:Uncharacterized protein n=1 Tax=Chionoecetes opilio TaxID=41210 RepID=A0A8J5D245_CHIOP|nr:hypothetical protein GWK47_035868 [Chionoecetes opilio]
MGGFSLCCGGRSCPFQDTTPLLRALETRTPCSMFQDPARGKIGSGLLDFFKTGHRPHWQKGTESGPVELIGVFDWGAPWFLGPVKGRLSPYHLRLLPGFDGVIEDGHFPSDFWEKGYQRGPAPMARSATDENPIFRRPFPSVIKGPGLFGARAYEESLGLILEFRVAHGHKKRETRRIPGPAPPSHLHWSWKSRSSGGVVALATQNLAIG